MHLNAILLPIRRGQYTLAEHDCFRWSNDETDRLLASHGGVRQGRRGEELFGGCLAPEFVEIRGEQADRPARSCPRRVPAQADHPAHRPDRGGRGVLRALSAGHRRGRGGRARRRQALRGAPGAAASGLAHRLRPPPLGAPDRHVARPFSRPPGGTDADRTPGRPGRGGLRRGRPARRRARPEDLERHVCLSYSDRLSEGSWRFESPAGPKEIPVGSRFCVNNSEAVREVALEHHGIALLPTFVVWRDLAAGSLVRLLPQCKVHGLFGSHVRAVSLASRRASPKIRAFVDFYLEQIGTPPYWDRAGA